MSPFSKRILLSSVAVGLMGCHPSAPALFGAVLW